MGMGLGMGMGREGVAAKQPAMILVVVL